MILNVDQDPGASCQKYTVSGIYRAPQTDLV